MPGVDQGAAPAYPPAPPPARLVAPAAYRGYPPASTQDYGYGAWPPESGPQPAVAQNYQDGYSYGCSSTVGSYEAKPYFQPSATQHASTNPYYHSNSQGGYNPPVTTYSPSQPQRHLVPIKPVQTTNAASSSYSAYPTISTSQQSLPPPSVQTYTPSSSYTPATPTYTSSPASYTGSNYSTYDTAAYTGTNVSHYQPSQQPLLPPPPQQAPQQVTPGWGGVGGASTTGSYNQKPPFPAKPQKPKPSPKQPQLHYCDICKISCAGPQTYREHLEGQKHKKKEAALKTGGPATGVGPRGIHTQLHCELCVISCTGADAYTAHIQGAKHQKVLKLHAKLGKPIPSSKPTLVNISLAPANGLAGKQAPEVGPVSSRPARSVMRATKCALASKKPLLVKKAPAANQAFTGPPKRPESIAEPEKVKMALPKLDTLAHEQPTSDGGRDGTADVLDIQPVGHNYVEEVLNDKGEMVHFRCKLCECNFNDPNAKDMHLKGYRHRLQYKKKVDPDLPVEIKPSSRARKMQEEKLKRQQLRALARRRQGEQQRWHLEMRRYEQEMYWRRVEEEELYWAEQQRRHLAEDRHLPRLMGRPIPPLLPGRRPSSSDDWHVMAKHSGIYPTEEELQAIQKAVSHSEEALRLVSNLLTKQEEEEGQTGDDSNEKGKVAGQPQLLKGVKRVGVLAKGLLLRGDRKVRLILISTPKPTQALLSSIAEQLPGQLEKVTSDPYDVMPDGEEGCLVVTSCKEPKIRVTVSLTSPLMREEDIPLEAGTRSETQVNSSKILNKDKCLESLAALRQAKWFQVRANGLQSCVIVLRVLRDLCQRVPTWGALPGWAMEILVEKALSSATSPLGPGEAIRRVLEFVAAGMLLTDGPGLQDPCEKEAVDALQGLSQQQREDITASGQHTLRMLAFRQIHKVLGMEPLPKSRPGGHSRKRRWGADEETEGEGDGKKDKKKDVEDEPGA